MTKARPTIATTLTTLTTLLFVAAALLAAPSARAEKETKDGEGGGHVGTLEPSRLAGTYKLTGGKLAGKKLDEAALHDVYTFTPDTITIRSGDKVQFEIKYTLDAKSTPTHIDMTTVKAPYPNAEGTKALGIIALDGDNLKLAYDPKGGDRPTSFDSNKAFSYELRRTDHAK